MWDVGWDWAGWWVNGWIGRVMVMVMDMGLGGPLACLRLARLGTCC